MKSMIIGLLLLPFVLLSTPSVQAQDVDVPNNLTMRDSTDSTVGNVLKEGVPFIHNFGINNTFIGKNAGNLTMTGDSNTASGVEALLSNTDGSFNTAIGRGALQSNSTGSFNTASGVNALQSNNTGSQNTASGFFALQRSTEGINNTASGYFALFSNTTGSFNTASGTQALVSNNTGSSNTASGVEALFSNTTGNFNTASGQAALFNNIDGTDNTASGRAALLNNTAGGANTAMGDSALQNNTTGNFNTAIGAGANVSAGNLTNATAIGAFALVNTSNKIRLGNIEVTVVEGPPYSVVSDRNQKENFQPVDGEQVLRKIGGLSLTSWNYIGHDPKQFRHYGPVAQEFFAAFGNDGIGTIGTDTTISSTDMAGILMIAVQALEKRTVELKEKEAKIGVLEARLEALERLVKITQTAMRASTE